MSKYLNNSKEIGNFIYLKKNQLLYNDHPSFRFLNITKKHLKSLTKEQIKYLNEEFENLIKSIDKVEVYSGENLEKSDYYLTHECETYRKDFITFAKESKKQSFSYYDIELDDEISIYPAVVFRKNVEEEKLEEIEDFVKDYESREVLEDLIFDFGRKLAQVFPNTSYREFIEIRHLGWGEGIENIRIPRTLEGFKKQKELSYEGVKVIKGKHKGKIGYYDDETSDYAIVYFGEPFLSPYYYIPFENLEKSYSKEEHIAWVNKHPEVAARMGVGVDIEPSSVKFIKELNKKR